MRNKKPLPVAESAISMFSPIPDLREPPHNNPPGPVLSNGWADSPDMSLFLRLIAARVSIQAA
jgi:hypothetical protein